MKNILVIFVEVTHYNLARIKQVYEKFNDIDFYYVYCHRSISGHITKDRLPEKSWIIDESKEDLYQIIRKRKWNVIIINGYVEIACIEAIVYAKTHGIPYAIETDTQLNIPNKPLKRLIKKIFLNYIFSGKAFGFAGGTRQRENFLYYGMEQKKVFVLPMSVDTSKLREVASKHSKKYYKESYGYENYKLILYAGRFSTEKNVPLLLRAAKYLRKEHFDFKLILIGKGNQGNEYHEKILKDEMEQYVEIKEYLPFESLGIYYSMADIFVLPSTFEPWGLVVNEALACRTPVLASSAVGAAVDLILPGINGDVFESGNVNELTLKIEEWLYNRTCLLNEFSYSDRWNYDLYVECLKEALEVMKDA